MTSNNFMDKSLQFSRQYFWKWFSLVFLCSRQSDWPKFKGTYLFSISFFLSCFLPLLFACLLAGTILSQRDADFDWATES